MRYDHPKFRSSLGAVTKLKVKLLLYLSAMSGRRVGGVTANLYYRFQHSMELSGQLHVPAALLSW